MQNFRKNDYIQILKVVKFRTCEIHVSIGTVSLFVKIYTALKGKLARFQQQDMNIPKIITFLI